MSKANEKARKIGRLLQKERERKQWTKREVAENSHFTESEIGKYETGGRTPKEVTLINLSRAYECEHLAAELLRIAGYLRELPDLIADLKRLEGQTSAENRTRLRAKLGDVLKELQNTQNRNVEWGILLVAGWQAKCLRDRVTARLVKETIEEGKKAGIHRFLLVAQKEQYNLLSEVRKATRSVDVRLVVQGSLPGIGGAILAAEPIVREPFMLMFPDDEIGAECVRSLKAAFQETGSCTISMRVVNNEEPETSGIVTKAKQVDDGWAITKLEEKGRGKAQFKILGRYVLTEDIYDKLREIKPNARTGLLEITDALQATATDSGLRGIVYTGDWDVVALRDYLKGNHG